MNGCLWGLAGCSLQRNQDATYEASSDSAETWADFYMDTTNGNLRVGPAGNDRASWFATPGASLGPPPGAPPEPPPAPPPSRFTGSRGRRILADGEGSAGPLTATCRYEPTWRLHLVYEAKDGALDVCCLDKCRRRKRLP